MLLSAALNTGHVDKGFECLRADTASSAEGDVCSDVRATLSWASMAVRGAVDAPARANGSAQRVSRAIEAVSTARSAPDPALVQVAIEPSGGALRPCAEVHRGTRRRTPFAGQALCDDATPGLLVPAFLHEMGDSRHVRDAVSAVRALSALLPHAAPFEARAIGEPADGVLPARIVQFFFVSLHGVVGVWNDGHEPPFVIHGPLFDLRGLSYHRAFMNEGTSRDRDYGSDPYLDLGGYGVVRTACRSVADPEAGGLFGAVCVDYVPPIRLEAKDEPLMRHDLIALDLSSGEPEVRRNGGVFSDGAIERVRRSMRDTSQSPNPWQSLVSVRKLTEALYAVPLRRDGSTLYFLLVKPRRAHRSLWLYLTVFLAVLTSFAIAWALMSRRRDREAENEDAVLRNLQVGAIRTNAESRIVMANDRAEELLGIRLPGVHEPAEVPGPKFWDQFHDEAFETKKGSRDLEHVTRREIEARRRRGEGSRYFMRKKDRARGLPEKADWLELHGTPELFVEDDDASRGTFGILTVPSDQRLAELREKWWQRLPPRAAQPSDEGDA
ncbi:MAG: PAS domain-containing protein [Sandaracinaceae bacterium]